MAGVSPTDGRRLKILVVDDEPPARARLVSLLRDLGVSEPVAEADNGLAALTLIGERAPDVVLLDIRMPGMDGLEVARHLMRMASPPSVIFTTAYDEHALTAFEVHAVDYLLKPVRRERLQQALGRARQLGRGQANIMSEASGQARTHISATLHGNLKLLPVAEVRYFLADQKYVTVGYPGGELLIDDPLKALEAEFGGRFLRVHRNALVAVAHVQGLEKDGTGRYVLRLRGVAFAPEVSRRLLTAVKLRLRSLARAS